MPKGRMPDIPFSAGPFSPDLLTTSFPLNRFKLLMYKRIFLRDFAGVSEITWGCERHRDRKFSAGFVVSCWLSDTRSATFGIWRRAVVHTRGEGLRLRQKPISLWRDRNSLSPWPTIDPAPSSVDIVRPRRSPSGEYRREATSPLHRLALLS